MYNHAPVDYDSPFARIAAGEPTDKNRNQEPYVFYRDEYITAFVSSKQWPNNPGNVMLIPNQVYENLYDIPDTVLGKIHAFSKQVAIAMKETYDCDGVSVRQHNEPAGNQEVWHYHLHVFPRYDNDYLYALHRHAGTADSDVRLSHAKKLKEYFINKEWEICQRNNIQSINT